MNVTIHNIVWAAQRAYNRNELDFGWERYHYCQAWISQPIALFGVGCQVVRSYETIVAIVLEGHFIEYGKYSRTTSKQVTQIYNEMFSGLKREYIERE